MTTFKRFLIIIFLVAVTVAVYMISGDLSISGFTMPFIIMTIKTKNEDWYREDIE